MSTIDDKITDTWATPPALLAFVRDYFRIERFDFDACASVANAVAPQWLGTQADGTFLDALAHPWNPKMPGGTAWCNPPYSRGNVQAFADRAILQFGQRIDASGILAEDRAPHLDRVIFLAKLDPSTRWFQTLARTPRCHEVVLLTPRVHFLHPETGKPVRGTNFCSVLFDLRRTTPKRKTISYKEFKR